MHPPLCGISTLKALAACIPLPFRLTSQQFAQSHIPTKECGSALQTPLKLRLCAENCMCLLLHAGHFLHCSGHIQIEKITCAN